MNRVEPMVDPRVRGTVRRGILLAVAFSIPWIAGSPSEARAGEPPDRKKEVPKPAWEKIYPADKLIDIHLTISKGDWDRLPHRPFEYVPAGFQCGSVAFPRVGFRVKGNSSSSVRSPRKSLKIDFDRFEKKCRFHGVVKMNLHNGFKDPTMMREHLAYTLFRKAGVPSSRVGFARVFITIPGECRRKYLGIYSNVEQVNGTFLRDRFEDSKGNLWKGEGGSDFIYLGEDPENYGPYELKRNENRGDYSRLIEFTRIVNETPDASFGDAIEKRLDVEKFLVYTAVNTLLANLDSPAGTGHNYYIYHDPKTDRFTIIPWDLNEAFGNFRMGSGQDMETMSIDEPYAGDKTIFRRILSVNRFRDRYRAILKELVAGPFSPGAMAKEVDRLYRLIRKAVEEDPLMSFSNEEFRRAIEEDLPGRGPRDRHGGVLGLKSFVKNRAASVKAQLAGREKGVKPRGRAFRGPPPSAGPIRGVSAVSKGSLYLLSAEGKLTRFAVDSMKEEAGAFLPKAVSAGGEKERKDPRRGGEREMTIYPGETIVAVIGRNTLYAFEANHLKDVGHNRFGRPAGTHFERRGLRRGPPPRPVATGEGDRVWIVTEDKVLRMDLKTLRVKAEGDLPPVGGSGGGEEWIRTLDKNGDGVIDRFEWRDFRGPPERFQLADRNRDGFLDRKEVKELPPLPGKEEASGERRVFLSDEGLLVTIGDTLIRFDRMKLKILGTTRLRKGK